MKRALLLLSMLGLGACASLSGAPASDADIAAYRAAMIATGCVVTNQDDASVVEIATGFDDDKLEAITDYLVETGEVVRVTRGDEGGIKLKSDQCP